MKMSEDENKDKAQEEDKEINLYEKFILRSKELFELAQEKTAATYNKSIESAKEEMVQAGKFSREQGERLKKYLERDLMSEDKGVGKISKTLKETLEPQRVGSGIQSTLGKILHALGNAFSEWSSKIEDNLNYKTGELTSPGTLVCKKCEAKMRFKKTGRIPPCPKCSSTGFKKTY
jgi:hypothetical protein